MAGEIIGPGALHAERLDGRAGATIEEVVAERIDSSPIGPVQMRTVFLCVLLAALDGYDLASMGLAVPLIARDWHIAAGAFGPAFAAVMIGIATGNMLFGWLGDRFGRKPVIIISTCLVGLVSLATISASDVTGITVWRFLLGVAFGATFPNIYALVADVVPLRRRGFCMTLLTTSTSIGAIAGGLAAPALSDQFGWHGIFLAGGLIPLMLVPVVIFWIGESPKVLAVRNRLRDLVAVLEKLGLDSGGLPNSHGRLPARAGRPVDLLRDGLFLISVLYVLGWVLSGLVYYILANWLPSLLVVEGWSSAAAQRSVTLVYGGGVVGSLILSWIMDRSKSGGLMVPVGGYLAGAVLFVAAGYLMTSSVFYVLLAGLGFAVCGCQGLMPVLAARLYPPRLLATSISWIGACSRVGAICGPLLGGWMLLSGWSGARIMTVLSIPPLLCAIAFGALAIVATRRSDKRLSRDASDDGTAARQNPDSGQALPAKLVAS